MKGVSWQLGNGKGVKFWKDNWALLDKCLKDLAIALILDDFINLEVCNFVNSDGFWDWGSFDQLLLAGALNHIVAIKPPSLYNGPDCPY